LKSFKITSEVRHTSSDYASILAYLLEKSKQGFTMGAIPIPAPACAYDRALQSDMSPDVQRLLGIANGDAAREHYTFLFRRFLPYWSAQCPGRDDSNISACAYKQVF
jgi:hypothetical protein